MPALLSFQMGIVNTRDDVSIHYYVLVNYLSSTLMKFGTPSSEDVRLLSARDEYVELVPEDVDAIYTSKRGRVSERVFRSTCALKITRHVTKTASSDNCN